MIYMGGISKDPVSGDPLCYNWMWGKVPSAGESGAPIMVSDIIFENLDFNSPLAKRHNPVTGNDGTGNYFGNCDRNCCPVSFNSIQIKNCSIQNAIRGGFTVENNAFLNYCTRSSSQYMFSLRYIPGDTEFHVHNNLFIQVKDADDTRAMNLVLVDVRQVNTEPYSGITVGISGNYGCTWDPDGQKDDGTPTGSKFSDSKNSFGGMTKEEGWTPGITDGSELKVLCGSTPLLPTELMRSPNPPHHSPDPLMHQRESLDGLFYNHTDDKVVNHEIYKLGIGDTRWCDAFDMQTFWLLKANE